MSALPEYMIPIFATFAPVFSNPVWANAQLLLIGAILCRGRRTVAAALRVMGRAEEAHFVNYHRVLNRAVWSALQGGQILLGLLVALLPASVPVIVGIDETLERRGGKRIKAKGVYRDAVRSSKKNTVHCFGLKWISMMLLVPMPWASGVWALPFLTILAPSKKANEKAGRRHKTTLDWARQMMLQLRRWLPDRAIILIGDGTYACVRFALACKQHSVVLVSRLRLDARLFDFPGPQPKSKRGPKPKKGKRLDSLKQRAQDPGQPWRTATVRWYGGQRKEVTYLTGTCLWHRQGEDPVAIRYVLVQEGTKGPEAFFSTDLAMEALLILGYYVRRWRVEVTFEEARRHLGLETQRQWSDKAIARSTPVLLGLFSLVTLLAWPRRAELTPGQAAWYRKGEVTFSDVLEWVRRDLWQEQLAQSGAGLEGSNFRGVIWDRMLEQLALAA